MADQFIGEEATGVFVGTLVEDMIETVKNTGKLYCNVLIERFFQKDTNYPLTYVPLWAMSLPLRKDDKVLVTFHQNNLMYPVLYKNNTELDDFDQFYEKFDTKKSVSGGNINGYEPKDTVGAQRIGVDSYLIKTDDYTVIHQNNGFILIDKDDKVYVYGSEINVISDGDVKIDSNGKTQIFSSSDIEIKNNTKITIEAKSTVEVKTNADVNITANAGYTVNNHLKVFGGA